MTKHEALKTYYGHDAFRDGQEPLIDALLAGRDALGIMPTGAGKSVCYQIPALMKEGVTLVISPLISLMKDQVAALISAGIPAAYLNSSLTPRQLELATQRATEGRYRIIYVAPERLEAPSFQRFAAQVHIALLAVDEAHCVSQWGQDFRPHYLRIANFVNSLPERPPVGAFTATATQRVREDIISLLDLKSPVTVTTGFDRPNLFFEVLQPADRKQALLTILARQEGRCGIVYCNTRRHVEEVAVLLQKQGFDTARYHAGLSDAERKQSQEDFQYDRVQVLVATNAFGMGIDKSNVGFVIHYNMPKSIEAYYQEAGRAGRDGQPAECVLLYSGQDVVTGKYLIEHGEVSADLTDAEAHVKRETDLRRLLAMAGWCKTGGCLRGELLRYFGQSAPARCGGCANCVGSHYAWADIRRGKKRRATAFFDDQAPAALPMKPGWKPASASKAPRDEDGSTLFDQLRACRLQLAHGLGVPPYIICDDKTLYEMARRCPLSPDALLEVRGMGVAKVGKYGPAFLDITRRWRAAHPAENTVTAEKAAAGKVVTVEKISTTSPTPKTASPAPVEASSAPPPWVMPALPADPHPTWTALDDRRLQEAYLDGESIERLADRFGRPEADIADRLARLGLTSANTQEATT